jgi:hypothetical protein
MGVATKDFDKLEEQSSEEFKKYANFRANLRLLRYNTDLSAEALGKTLQFKKFHRIRMLEEGKGATVRLEEAEAIATFFKISIEFLLYRKAKITFEE